MTDDDDQPGEAYNEAVATIAGVILGAIIAAALILNYYYGVAP